MRSCSVCSCSVFFFFNDTATTEIYTLSLHDALPICPRFLYCPFLVAAAPPLFILPISCCGSALPFILTISRCDSDLAIYTDHFSLRKRPRFLYCPFLVAAAPPIFILTGSAINFLLAGSPCGCAPAIYTAHFLLRQRPRFLYCPFLVAAKPSLFILTNFSLRQRSRFLY